MSRARRAGVVASLALAALLGAGPRPARAQTAEAPWFAELTLGTIQPGINGTDLGAGQNYGGALGYRVGPTLEFGFVLAWAHARNTLEAIDTDITSGGVRGRAFAGNGRLRPYGEVGARLYHLDVQAHDVQDPRFEKALRVGGAVGAGLHYTRSTWWGGLGAELHGIVGDANIEGTGFATYVTYDLFVGIPLR